MYENSEEERDVEKRVRDVCVIVFTWRSKSDSFTAREYECIRRCKETSSKGMSAYIIENHAILIKFESKATVEESDEEAQRPSRRQTKVFSDSRHRVVKV